MNEIVYTRHAGIRMRQRGLRERDVPLILKCGTRLDDETWFVRDRDARRAIEDRKREIRTLERLAGRETTPRKCGARPDDGTRFVCGRDARRGLGANRTGRAERRQSPLALQTEVHVAARRRAAQQACRGEERGERIHGAPISRSQPSGSIASPPCRTSRYKPVSC